MKKLLFVLSLGLLTSPVFAQCPVATLTNAIDGDQSHDTVLTELQTIDPAIAAILQQLIDASDDQREAIGMQAASKLGLKLKVKLGMALKKYNPSTLSKWLNKKKTTTIKTTTVVANNTSVKKK